MISSAAMGWWARKLVLGLILATVCLANASKTSAQTFAEEAAKLMAEPEFPQASWGILIANLDTGETLYELNADKLFVPASTTKLFSVAAALETLGADYRFRTPVYARGEIDANGILKGDLILVASGDLTMGGRTDVSGRIEFSNADHTYAGFSPGAALTSADPVGGLKEIARQIKASGVKQVDGNVLIDDRLFEAAPSSGSGPEHCSPIVINDNLIDVTIKPTKPGKLAEVTWRPECSALVVDARVMTVEASEKTDIKIETPDDRALLVRGRIAADAEPALRPIEVRSATNFARRLLIDALQAEGVAVEASTVAENRAADLPAADTYAQAKHVALLESPPFSENARLILKVSHNLHASTLPLLMAAKNGQRTLAEGLKLEREALAKLGVEVGTISFGGGAGGTRGDYVTPRAAVALLTAMSKRPDAQIYRDALPILGVDGTLVSAVEKESAARGKIVGKTGTFVWENGLNGSLLLTSKAAAGYGETAKGTKVAFAFFVNNVHLTEKVTPTYIGKKLGRLCELMYEGL
jgi:D-alanyl-D-alanine carboxypeptidase/D-alanyl-D-alanine-endopeptidase (penicillin-binding protein 4)